MGTDQSACQSQCTNGLCMQKGTAGDLACFACVKCPDGTQSSQDACQSQCDGECLVVGSEGNLSCFQCQESCADFCASKGYIEGEPDFSNYILSVISGVTCASSYEVRFRTGIQRGSCLCYSRENPDVIIDRTVPVCRGTPCGDVACGQSASCPGGPNETITVSCTWGGWQKTGKNEFVPRIGQ